MFEALTAGPAELRDHAEEILRATIRDMRGDQTAEQQAEKSKGRGIATEASGDLNDASAAHGAGRVGSGIAPFAPPFFGCGVAAGRRLTCATWTTSRASMNPLTSQ